MRNMFPGKCYRCGEHVPAGEGHFEKARGVRPALWVVQHATCAIELRGNPKGREEAVAAALAARHFDKLD